MFPSKAPRANRPLTYLDDFTKCVDALERINTCLEGGRAITPAEAAQLQVAAEDLSTCADWMEAG